LLQVYKEAALKQMHNIFSALYYKEAALTQMHSSFLRSITSKINNVDHLSFASVPFLLAASA